MQYELTTYKVALNVTERPGKVADTPTTAENILRAIYATLDADQEHFVVLALNGRNRIIGYKILTSGGMGESIADPKLLFRALLTLGARAGIVCHNHPSGDPLPSESDKAVTRELTQAGKLLELPIFDHLILGTEGKVYSFQQSGGMT